MKSPMEGGGSSTAAGYNALDGAFQATTPKLSLLQAILGVILPSLVVFVLMDMVWIVLVAGPLFKQVLGDMLRPQPGIAAGVLAWMAIVGGTYVFVGCSAQTRKDAFLKGLVFGLVLYTTYEMTNLSLITPWTWGLAIGDMAWGSFACGSAAAFQLFMRGVVAQSRFLGSTL